MRNTNKKGFTIVELVIVVAVIAILAAVLIPTFTGIIAKAQLSADQKAVREMNNAIAMESATTLEDAIAALEKHGINAEYLIPVSAGYSFIWNDADKKIELVEGVVDETVEEAKKNIAVTVDTAEALIDAINDDLKYIKLEADVTLSNVLNIPTGKVTIDLNGKKLSAPSVTRPFNLSNGSEVVIDAEGATIECGKYGIANFDSVSASLTINGGTFTGELDKGAFIKVRPGAGDVKVTLNNVNFADESANSYIVNSAGAEGNVEIIVNGGNYKAALGIQAKNISIDGATIVTDSYAVHASKSLTVNNSNITSNGKYEKNITGDGSMPAACVSVQSGGEATVTNSKFTYVKYDGATSQGAAIVIASSGGKIIVDNKTTITGVEYLDTVKGKIYEEGYHTVSYIEIAGDVKVDYDSNKK